MLLTQSLTTLTILRKTPMYLHQRLKQQLEFIIEIDKVKNIFRRARNIHEKRYENDAEHAWHMSLMAMVLHEYANDQAIDFNKVIKMALIHDLVEIDAGDTFIYADNQGDKADNELRCSRRLFGLLPEDQRDEMMALWQEFEKKESPESKFAGALDRLGPVMQNYLDEGHAWKKHNVSAEKVRKVNKQIQYGSETLWEYVQSIIDEMVEAGHLSESEKR
jgi:putative hydrolase of HD superfamily